MAGFVSVSEELKRAKLYETFKRFDKAVEVYRQLIELYSGDFRAHFNCGRLLAFQENTLEEALGMFKTVIKLDATVVEAYGAASALLIKLNRPEEAAACCRAGLAVNSQDQNCMYNLNIALRQVGDIEIAISRCWDILVRTFNVEPCASSQQPMSALHPHSPQQVTAVCVKWGDKYGPEYVNNLHRAIRRHDTPARISKLICFTDDSTGISRDVKCLPFDPSTLSWKGWWLKAQIFAPSEHLEGWVLYIDLDTVVCDSLSFLADLTMKVAEKCGNEHSAHTTGSREHTYSSDTAVAVPAEQDIFTIYVLGAETFLNEARKVGMNSSLLLWHTCNTTLQTLYTFLQHHFDSLTKVIYKFDHYLEMMLYKHLHRPTGKAVEGSCSVDSVQTNDTYLSIVDFAGLNIVLSTQSISTAVQSTGAVDVYTAAPRCCYFQDYCTGRIVDYFQYTSPQLVPPAVVPSIICFPLKPKPHQLQDSAFIRQHWLGEVEVIASAETVD